MKTYSVERDIGLYSCKVDQSWELWRHWSPWGIPRSPYRPRGVCGQFLMIISVLVLFYPGDGNENSLGVKTSAREQISKVWYEYTPGRELLLETCHSAIGMAWLAVRVGYGSRRNRGTHVTLKESKW